MGYTTERREDGIWLVYSDGAEVGPYKSVESADADAQKIREFQRAKH